MPGRDDDVLDPDGAARGGALPDGVPVVLDRDARLVAAHERDRLDGGWPFGSGGFAGHDRPDDEPAREQRAGAVELLAVQRVRAVVTRRQGRRVLGDRLPAAFGLRVREPCPGQRLTEEQLLLCLGAPAPEGVQEHEVAVRDLRDAGVDRGEHSEHLGQRGHRDFGPAEAGGHGDRQQAGRRQAVELEAGQPTVAVELRGVGRELGSELACGLDRLGVGGNHVRRVLVDGREPLPGRGHAHSPTTVRTAAGSVRSV